MICVGRSNCFRFNHPEEAQRMKTILPNARISSVPLHFATAAAEPPGNCHFSSIKQYTIGFCRGLARSRICSYQ